MRRAALLRIMLIGLALIAVFVTGELVLRIASALGLDLPVGHEHNPNFVLSENDELLVEMDPNDPHLNAAGQRDRDYAREKPPNTARIVALGDSVTYGHSIELEAAYPKQLEALLNAEDRGTHYEVINFGVGGYNTRQELEHFEQNARRYRPDLLLIGYTMNDVLDTKTFLGVMGGEGSVLRRSRFAAWLMDRSAGVHFGPQPPAYFVPLYRREANWRIVRESFRRFAQIAREDGFSVVLAIFPYLDGLSPYRYGGVHRAVELEAGRQGFTVLDLLPAFQEHDLDEMRLVASDPVHPSREGHAAAARAIHAHLAGYWKPPAGVRYHGSP